MPYATDEQRRAVWARRRRKQKEQALPKLASFARAFASELDKLSSARFATSEQRLSLMGKPPGKKKSLTKTPKTK